VPVTLLGTPTLGARRHRYFRNYFNLIGAAGGDVGALAWALRHASAPTADRPSS
jgi:hypothetical protein